MSDVDALWQQAPAPALRLWPEAGAARWQLNRAAAQWSLQHGVRDADWQALAGRLLQGEGPAAQGSEQAGAWALQWCAVALAPGWLLWLSPQAGAAPRAPEGWRDAEEKLALVQGFGRMGFFERSVRGGRDGWDRQMFLLFGLEPAEQPPPFEQALQRLHPDDRAALAEHHRLSMQRAGRYEVRYRLRLPDGRQRDMHALTEVRNGADGRPETMLGVLIDDTEGADRVRAQQAVSMQLARALDLAKISVWRIDLATQRMQMNDAGYRLSGLQPEPEGVPLERIGERVHPEDLPAVERAAAQALAGHGVVDVESRYRDSRGGWRHLLSRRVAERDASGQPVALTGISLDQTEQIAERERAQALARRIQLVADAAGVGVWTIDEGAAGGEGGAAGEAGEAGEAGGDGGAAAVEWNAQMFRIYGLPEQGPPPPVTQWMGRLVHAEDRQRLAAARRRAERAGAQDFEAEFRILRPDGSIGWVMCRSRRERRDGRSLRHGILVDLTQQRMLDEELRLQGHRLKLATQIAGVGIWDRDSDTRTILWDEQMYRLRGLQPDDPRTPREIDQQIVPPEALAERWRRIERHMADGQPYEVEFEVRWPDGSTRWLVSTGRAVRDAAGRARRMVGLNWDITQRKLAESALREAEAAERASRAKSEFLARMSHELRTPLNAMLGFAQLLEHDDGEPLQPAQRQRLQHIRSAGAHLLSLIDEVLDLSAVEAGSLAVALRPVALDDAVEEVRQWLAPLAAQHQVQLLIGPSGAHVRADARRLRQVLTNLLSNAIKYNRRGGQVVLTMRRLVVDGVPGWELGVRDTGRGLSVEQQAHLYEPFNRLGAEREGIEGRGIGLMTAHHLVQLMGGRLRLQSRPGEGSEFLVWLPLAEADTGAAAAHDEDRSRPAAGGGGLRLLYVEDNEVNVLVMREVVSLRPQMVLQVAVDGRSGIEAALQQPPDLLLVDMHLPDMDGLELLRRVRAQGLRSTLVALSANAMPDAVARARAAGFEDYWTKPIDVAQLLAHLDRLAATRSLTEAKD